MGGPIVERVEKKYRRGRVEIYGDILFWVKQSREVQQGRRISWSRIQSLAYIPQTRFKGHLKEMHDLALLDVESGEVLPAGEEFLSSYLGLVRVLTERESSSASAQERLRPEGIAARAAARLSPLTPLAPPADRSVY